MSDETDRDPAIRRDRWGGEGRIVKFTFISAPRVFVHDGTLT